MESVLEEINTTPLSVTNSPQSFETAADCRQVDRPLETIVTDATAGLALNSETEKIRHVMLGIMQDYQLLKAENKK
jgi:hypothetical protein